MTEQQYLQQNLAGFENDSFARDKIKQIITDNGIETVIETGTYLGSTTKLFALWVDNVFTIEVKKEHYDKAKLALQDFKNVIQYFGNSPEYLDSIFLKNLQTEKTFIFLDAHWEAYWPLLDELAVIAKHEVKPFIAIHDFKVPDHPELGFDTWNGKPLDFAYIEAAIIKIFGEGNYTVEYNSQATGAKRGICYIMPK